MKRILALGFLLLLSSCKDHPKTEAELIDEQRVLAFKEAAKVIQVKDRFASIDPYMMQNRQAMDESNATERQEIKLKGRTIDNMLGAIPPGYSVRFDDPKETTYFYDDASRLEELSFTSGKGYPKREYYYKYPQGKLVVVKIYLHENDCEYSFDPDGVQIPHDCD